MALYRILYCKFVPIIERNKPLNIYITHAKTAIQFYTLTH
jgi:hypothetical protein